MSREAMQMALDALDNVYTTSNDAFHKNACEVLLKALAQPEKEWVGLTEKDIVECFDLMPPKFARNIEAKLKEKNG